MNKREQILEEAKKCVLHDRNATHGEPENNFRDIAAYWSIYLKQEIKPHDVAAMMILVKVSRVTTSPGSPDRLGRRPPPLSENQPFLE